MTDGHTADSKCAGQNYGGVCFSVDEETQLILDSFDEFVQQEVLPLRNELGDTWSNPRLRHEPDGRFVPKVQDVIETIRRKSGKAGYYAMNLPEDVGGGGVSNVTWYRAKKQASSYGTKLAEYALAGPEGPKPLLLQAEGDQVPEFLEPTIRGEKSTAFAQTEPSVGSDSPNMKTTADKEGDEWIINGRKQWITNAPYADFVQVFARTTPQEEAGRHGGITCFLVENDKYEIGALNNAVGEVGMQAELLFDDVHVPESRVLGEPDSAFYNAMDFLSLGRLEISGMAIGQAEFLIEKAIDYARNRDAFDKLIGEFQQVSSKIARGRTKAEAGDSLALRCAWNMDVGEETVEASSIAKWYTTNALWEIADNVVQIHGANGLSEENPFMNLLHSGKILRIVEGTDEIQLNTIASEVGL